jgi:hypothetical protein
MTLSWCADLSPADWITGSDLPWDRLATFGPGGFPAYARLRFIPDPTRAGQSENDVDRDEQAPSDGDQLRLLLEMLAGHTRTPDDLYFCLWDGWGLDGGGVSTRPDGTRVVEQASFVPEMLAAPRVLVPHRAYLLFRGPLSELGDWGEAERWPGSPRTFSPEPAFVWPSDRAWCVAKDVDPHWAGIGADDAAIARLLAHPVLDVVRADPQEQQPQFR